MKNNRLSRRFLLLKKCPKPLSIARRYERYYISDKVRVQRKDTTFEKEELSPTNMILSKNKITENEFLLLIRECQRKIIRDSYLVVGNPNISIKVYFGDYEGLRRIEVEFSTKEEMLSYQKEDWMGPEITDTPLAFDTQLIQCSRKDFLEIMKREKTGEES